MCPSVKRRHAERSHQLQKEKRRMNIPSFTTSNLTFVAIMREHGIEPSSHDSEGQKWTYEGTPVFAFTKDRVLSERSNELAAGEVRRAR
jgi:hypothetical protein